MCRIAVCLKRKLTKEEFDNGWTANSDGVGFAYAKDDKVHAIKGLMEKEAAWKRYSECNMEFPHVVHFRKKSAGDVSAELTHPFIVSEDSPAFEEYHGEEPVLFHNGTITDWKQMLLLSSAINGSFKPGKWSDARFAAAMVSKFTDQENIKYFLEMVGGGDKFALVTKDHVQIVGKYGEKKDVYYSDAYPKYSYSK